MCAHYPRSLTYYSLYRLIALFSRRFGSLRPLFRLFLVLPLLLVFPLSFLPSPPPSPTFACSPGGTAIFARHEFALHEECVPSLRRWRALGRVVVASIRGHLGEKYVFVACYGLPVSHPQRGTNEVLLSDVLAYLSSLTCPSFLAGDLNDSVHSSPILSMASAIGVHDLTPNLPTTMKKDGQIANSPPLDHVMANRAALDCAPKVRIDYRILLSDHFPLSLTLNLQLTSTLQI